MDRTGENKETGTHLDLNGEILLGIMHLLAPVLIIGFFCPNEQIISSRQQCVSWVVGRLRLRDSVSCVRVCVPVGRSCLDSIPERPMQCVCWIPVCVGFLGFLSCPLYQC